MTYRRMPERSRAREQLDKDVAKKLRFLERRARYPGRLRQVTTDDITTTTAFSGVVASLNVIAGAWMVQGGVHVRYEAAVNASERATVTLSVYSRTSGLLITQLDQRQWARNGPTAGPVRESFHLMAAGSWGETVRFDLSVQLGTVGTAHPAIVDSPRIIALPV